MSSLADVTSAYSGEIISFGTMHGKHRHVADAFHRVLGAYVQGADGIDTDQFGTFTGDVERTLEPMECARSKALLGMHALGVTAGLASEASYGPIAGLMAPGHQEMLIFLDTRRGIEVLEGENVLHSLPSSRRVTTIADIGPELKRLDLSAQALIVRTDDRRGGVITKGIGNIRDLERAIVQAAQESDDGQAIVEPDLRAHHNRARRQVLTRVGWRLASRLATRCPQCHCPGYGRTTSDRGLPCAACGLATEQVKTDVHTCPRCPAEHREHRTGGADPAWCDRCNP